MFRYGCGQLGGHLKTQHERSGSVGLWSRTASELCWDRRALARISFLGFLESGSTFRRDNLVVNCMEEIEASWDCWEAPDQRKRVARERRARNVHFEWLMTSKRGPG
ncbi:hypothetical protein NDU88_006867 [Pleurodeles waltl]|uniref:Uncharacterized protein n=1 Tax=Pleurodeles waltl TaxID=8319 RepID=A0AAV7NT83_PLEWA|nr:hypothetical protein NDU88_006867 [Pleurodeles waltl]